ncbi:MAG: protein meaA, partial [Methylobacterium sp.]
VETGALKRALVESNAKRISAIEAGDQVVVGVNKFQAGEPSPLTAGEGAIFTVSETVEMEAEQRIRDWRAKRDDRAVARALEDLEAAARSGANIMPVSIAAAKAGVTTGEWGERLRQVFGEYRAPTGVTLETISSGAAQDAKLLIADLGERLGETPKLVVGKPGLDGHSNGAEQIALRARDVGFDVTYDGIRQTPAEIVAKAKATGAHVVGLSILSGSHVPLVRDVKAKMREAGLDHIPLVVGGIISPDDELVLKNMGVTAVYTPKDYVLDTIMVGIAKVVERALDKRAAEQADAKAGIAGATPRSDTAEKVF